MKGSKILLISDFVGVGKVALSMMIPILNAYEKELNPQSLAYSYLFSKVEIH